MLGEVVGSGEGQDMDPEGIEVRIVEGLDGGVLDGAVHPLGLAIGPGVVGLGELVPDAMLAADAVEDVAHPLGGGTVSVLRQIGESHAVVGEHGMDGIGEVATTSRRKAAPFILVAAFRKATWVNFETRSMARNMKSLPLARRSSQMSIWT
jgi:hypothetical protein